MADSSSTDPDDRNALAEAVRLVVELRLGRDTVSNGDRLVEDLEADSFDVMNIVAVLEENHDVLITEQAAADARTVADLIELVGSLTRQ